MKCKKIGISINNAQFKDCKMIHNIQIKSFAALLEKYEDYDTNPGNEKLEAIHRRFNQSFTDYYLIQLEELIIGALRLIKDQKKGICRVSPIFILPEYQGRGIAQRVFELVEEKHQWAKKWQLDTILEEKGLCHLYEKLGYKKINKQEIINEKMTIVYYEKEINL